MWKPHTGTSEHRKSPARRSHLKQFSVFIHCYPSQWDVRMLDLGQGLCLAGARSRSFVARVGTKDAARRVTLAARASLSPRELRRPSP